MMMYFINIKNYINFLKCVNHIYIYFNSYVRMFVLFLGRIPLTNEMIIKNKDKKPVRIVGDQIK